jgi:hypothetical protein
LFSTELVNYKYKYKNWQKRRASQCFIFPHKELSWSMGLEEEILAQPPVRGDAKLCSLGLGKYPKWNY